MSNTSLHRRLIVTADDFGASAEVNEAVVNAFKDGILRFASLMVAEDAAEDAVRRARLDAPRLGIGLHLVLCAGKSVLGRGRLGNLVESDGRFSSNPVLCGMRYFFDRRLLPFIEKEMRAQIERFLTFGLTPTYIDGHVNIQAHPVIFPLLLRLAREYGFKRVRLPGGELATSLSYTLRHLFSGHEGRQHAGTPLFRQLTEGLILEIMRIYLMRSYGDSRLAIPDRVFGLMQSGLMREKYLLECFKRLPAGMTEIYFHPSMDAGSADSRRPTKTHRSRTELEALTSPLVRDILRSEGILLEGSS